MTPDRAREILIGDAMEIDHAQKEYLIACMIAACEEEARLIAAPLKMKITTLEEDYAGCVAQLADCVNGLSEPAAVTPDPQFRKHLLDTFADDIRKVIYAYSGKLTLAETVGSLEFAKMHLMRDG